MVSGRIPYDAKPSVWTAQAKFKEPGDKMQAELIKPDAVAKTGNVANLKAAYRHARDRCKACHDAYTSQ
jgi:cytochrome c556